MEKFLRDLQIETERGGAVKVLLDSFEGWELFQVSLQQGFWRRIEMFVCLVGAYYSDRMFSTLV